jgi:hypothetical protein
VLQQDTDGKLHILREVNHEIVKLPAGRAETGNTPAQSNTSRGNSGNVAVVTDGSNLQSFIDSWLNAWRQQDVAGYFSHYHPDYKPDSATSATAWRNDRSTKISRPQFIQLQLTALEIVEQSDAEFLVRLSLEYRSNFYSDHTTKLLRMQRLRDGTLQIIMEKNTLVETVPLTQVSRPANDGLRVFARAVIERAL